MRDSEWTGISLGLLVGLLTGIALQAAFGGALMLGLYWGAAYVVGAAVWRTLDDRVSFLTGIRSSLWEGIVFGVIIALVIRSAT